MKRSAASLDDVAALPNLAAAFWKAARSTRRSSEIDRFSSELDRSLADLRRSILDLSVPVGHSHIFAIRDPKPRTIHAPVFFERVLHHALMAVVGPVLDRSLVDDTFACRTGKGALAAVKRAQQHACRFEWFGKLDIRAYFASVDHRILLGLLERRLKNNGLLRLCERIISAHEAVPGRGLPIGALYSQHFANFYLSGADRHLLERLGVAGMVRYMDDIVYWCPERLQARGILLHIRDYVQTELGLEVKPNAQVARSAGGVTFCGFRVFPAGLKLSRRRQRRYTLARRRWELDHQLGRASPLDLQRGYAGALAITLPAESLAWRREQLRRSPPPDC